MDNQEIMTDYQANLLLKMALQIIKDSATKEEAAQKLESLIKEKDKSK